VYIQISLWFGCECKPHPDCGVLPVVTATEAQQLELHLLDFDQALPLPRQRVARVFMQAPDFEFGLGVDLVIVLPARGS
jgi:hypothetical protein